MPRFGGACRGVRRLRKVKSHPLTTKPVASHKTPNLIYNIEVREAGVWEAVDYADSLEDALMLASSLCATVREEWIRISTPDFKII